MNKQLSYVLKRLYRIPYVEILFVLFIVVITVWGYYKTLDDFFIMNDFDMIRGHSTFNQFLKHWSSPFDANLYRPLIDLLFIWDFSWWGWNPFGWHLSNLIFHLLNTFLVYVLAKHLIKSPYAGMVAGGLFGLHASHTEAVTWISARMDVVCTTFFLLSVLSFISATVERGYIPAERKTRKKTYLLSLVFFACALFIKEMAVTLPLVVILSDLIFSTRWKFIRGEFRKKAKLYLPYFLVLLVYFGMRFWALHEFKGGYDVKLFGVFMFKNLVAYFKFLAIPFTDQIFSQSVVFNVVGIVFVTLVGVALSKESRFAILWIFITLLPVYAFDIERGAYLASVGFCILMGIVLTFDVGEVTLPCQVGDVTPTYPKRFRTVLRIVQIVLMVAVFYRYGVAIKESNAWWGRVAEINENVPRMVKALYPTFPDQSKICLQNVPLVFNQRFNNAFQFRYPHTQLRGIYVKDFEQCAESETAKSLRSTYFFHYDKDENVLYDLTFETREKMIDQQSFYVQRLSQEPQHKLSRENPQLQLTLDEISPVSAVGIVTSLANGIEVPQGTVVARGKIEGDVGIVETFDLVVGQDTAEWAIRFPNVQNVVKHTMPQAYRAWTVQQPDKTITVAQNYMKRITFQTPFVPTRLSLEFITSPAVRSDLMLDIDRMIFYTHQEIKE